MVVTFVMTVVVIMYRCTRTQIKLFISVYICGYFNVYGWQYKVYMLLIVGASDDFTTFQMEPWGNVTVGSFSLFVIIKIHGDNGAGHPLFKTSHNGHPFLYLRYITKHSLKLTGKC